MIRLTDGTKTAEIKMEKWHNLQYTPDFSSDFFEVGGLPYDEETDTYKVEDVEYCVSQAEDWKAGTGDYAEDPENWIRDGESYEDGERRLKEDLESRSVTISIF